MYKDKGRQREYQRNWVRQKRAKGSTVRQGSTIPDVIPKDDREIVPFCPALPKPVPPQSYNPMMVGYVPPVE